ncbi:Epidermal Growth Factor Receptor Kinase Substrate 8-Like Protein 3 [Manis pentadactyla]|nr:Epidermal Growth Factor Receptor Kinase Substrate 8-Like Protein 3 [Manis pentadactyla]
MLSSPRRAFPAWWLQVLRHLATRDWKTTQTVHGAGVLVGTHAKTNGRGIHFFADRLPLSSKLLRCRNHCCLLPEIFLL